MTARGVIFDLVAAQSPSYRGRGIARFSTDLVRAMVGAHPELVGSIVLHPGLPVPEGLDDLSKWLTMEPNWAGSSVLHLSSVFEPEVPVRTYWPREAASAHLVTAVTLYDLIPDVYPGWYLEDPGLRRRWRCCREVVRAADAVVTLSESAKQDAVALLGLPEERVSVIGSGTSPAFCRPASRQEAFKRARDAVEGLEEGFVIYNGAFNRRKNVDRLIEGYAALPTKLIERHQLVIVCEAPPLTRNHYLVMAKDLGIQARVLIPGFVPEPVLVSLHQSAELAVYPSLYEGYGLPVIESMACGTPNIAGDNSSLREILPREALFEPEDPWAISEAIARGLTDHGFRERLKALAAREPPSWTAVADRAATVFEGLLQRATLRRPGWRSRLQLALVAAPPDLVTATAALASCDSFEAPDGGTSDGGTSDGGTSDGGTTVRPARATEDRPISWQALEKLDAWRGGYDAVVAWASGLGDHGLEMMEQLAAKWPGRCMLVFDREQARGERAVISQSDAPSLIALAARDGAGWDETASLVVDAARRAPG